MRLARRWLSRVRPAVHAAYGSSLDLRHGTHSGIPEAFTAGVPPYTIGSSAQVHRKTLPMPSPQAPLSCSWSGVLPAVTTQFDADLRVDLAATRAVQSAMVDDGVHGLVVLGTCGENNSLTAEEKRSVLRTAVGAAGGRVPIIVGVSELTTAAAVAFAKDAEALGANVLMVLPAMVYVPTPHELEFHFRSVAEATRLPIMLYNNPPAYRVSIETDTLRRLADVPNIVAVKESAPDPRRFTDVVNACGDRFALFAGLDDVMFEGMV